MRFQRDIGDNTGYGTAVNGDSCSRERHLCKVMNSAMRAQEISINSDDISYEQLTRPMVELHHRSQSHTAWRGHQAVGGVHD